MTTLQYEKYPFSKETDPANTFADTTSMSKPSQVNICMKRDCLRWEVSSVKMRTLLVLLKSAIRAVLSLQIAAGAYVDINSFS